MPSKLSRVLASGVGRFPIGRQSPVMITVDCHPLHESDEWEQSGRPFWLLRYAVGNTGRVGTDDGYLYARTMTPTFCPLSVVSIPPIAAGYVEAGAVGEWIPAVWREVRDMRSGIAACRVSRKLNPVMVVFWRRDLWAETAQQYAANLLAESGVCSPAPRLRYSLPVRAEPDVQSIDPILQLADDGGPAADQE